MLLFYAFSTLIFTNDRTTANDAYAMLRIKLEDSNILSIGCLKGQSDTNLLCEQLRNGEIDVLICDDMTASLAPLPQVDHIIHFDLPLPHVFKRVYSDRLNRLHYRSDSIDRSNDNDSTQGFNTPNVPTYQENHVLDSRMSCTSTALFNPYHTNAAMLAKCLIDVLSLSRSRVPDWLSQYNNIDVALVNYGLESHDVGGDGNCQFLAAGHHLEVAAVEVRRRVVAELRKNSNLYKDCADEWAISGDVNTSRQNDSYEQFVNNMAQQGVWGGNTTLYAMANAFGD